MASILDFLGTDTGKEFIQKSSKEVEESPEKVKNVFAMALPMMLGAMKKNTHHPEGARKLDEELGKEKHNGAVLDAIRTEGLSGLLPEGSRIIQHIFGGKQHSIVQAVSSATGLDESKVGKLISMAAPVILGILGKQKRKDNTGSGGISNLIGSVMGANTNHDQSLLETFLDSDSQGSIAKDMAGKLFGGGGKSKGLGSFFKG